MKSARILSVLGVAGLLVCTLLFIYFPAVPRTVLGWVALVFLGLPVWFLLEWLGEMALGGRFMSRKSSAARIAIAVPVVAALIVLAIVLVGLVQRVIVSV